MTQPACCKGFPWKAVSVGRRVGFQDTWILVLYVLEQATALFSPAYVWRGWVKCSSLRTLGWLRLYNSVCTFPCPMDSQLEMEPIKVVVVQVQLHNCPLNRCFRPWDELGHNWSSLVTSSLQIPLFFLPPTVLSVLYISWGFCLLCKSPIMSWC